MMVVLALVVSVAIPFSAQSGESDSICWITEAWPKFTQEDGKGIYHDLVNAVYGTQNITVAVNYAPWKRAVETVKHGRCDMTGGIESSRDFHQSKYPVFEYRDLIVFKKERLDWNGLESLTGKSGVWVRGFINDDIDRPIKKFATGDEVTNFETALKMLNAGRSDYFIGEFQALKNFSKRVVGMDLSTFEIVDLASGQLYMSFPRNERGAKIRDIYDRGVEALGPIAITKIYEKWGLTAPVLDR